MKRTGGYNSTFRSVCSDCPQDNTDQSILIETSSCNLQFFSELITTQLRDFHMVSPQVAFPYLSTSPCKATSFTFLQMCLSLNQGCLVYDCFINGIVQRW